MRAITNPTISSTLSDIVSVETSAVFSVSGVSGAEAFDLQISGNKIDFVDYYEGGSQIQLTTSTTSVTVKYPGYYRISVPNTSLTCVCSVSKPEWNFAARDYATWSPKYIRGVAQWYDASDPESIIHVAGSVSQWNDKSGNGSHATQSVEVNKPQYSTTEELGPGLVFAAGDEFDYPDTAINRTVSSVFMVIDLGAAVELVRTIYHCGTGGSAPDGNGTLIECYGGDLTSYNGIDGDTYNIGVARAIVAMSGLNMVSSYLDVDKKKGYVSSGGVVQGSLSWTGERTYSKGQGRKIGGNNYDGVIYEIVTAGPLSQGESNKVEGYLAHKWGFVLPNFHPYKREKP